MGNQHGNKRKANHEDVKSVPSVPQAKKSKKKNKKNAENLIISAPILIKNSSPKTPTNKPDFRVKIFPSYNKISDCGLDGYDSLDSRKGDIKVYRRCKDRYKLEKNAGAATISCSASRDYPELGRRSKRWDSLSDSRSSRTSNASSLISVCPKVARDDFPSILAIKERLTLFEDIFVQRLTQKYSSLPAKTQLASVAIALRVFPSRQSISLLAYLKSDSIPLHLTSSTNGKENGASEYVLTIPKTIFQSAYNAKQDKTSDSKVLSSVAREIVTRVAAEAASEISRIYEYQIGLLGESLCIEMLANHACDCVVHYIIGQGGQTMLLDQNSIVQGVVRGQAKNFETKFLSVIVGMKELKWDLFKILKKPGLRKESLLYAEESDMLEQCSNPWTYHTSADYNPMLYGYRGIAMDWDFVEGAYRISPDEERLFDEEVTWRYDDFHRLYSPYCCLIGQGVMQTYLVQISAEDSVKKSLQDYVKTIMGASNTREEIQPMYRPLTSVAVSEERNLVLKRAVLSQSFLGSQLQDKPPTKPKRTMSHPTTGKPSIEAANRRPESYVDSGISSMSPGSENDGAKSPEIPNVIPVNRKDEESIQRDDPDSLKANHTADEVKVVIVQQISEGLRCSERMDDPQKMGVTDNLGLKTQPESHEEFYTTSIELGKIDQINVSGVKSTLQSQLQEKNTLQSQLQERSTLQSQLQEEKSSHQSQLQEERSSHQSQLQEERSSLQSPLTKDKSTLQSQPFFEFRDKSADTNAEDVRYKIATQGNSNYIKLRKPPTFLALNQCVSLTMDVKNGGNSGSSTMPKCISGQRWQLTGEEPAALRISSERNKLCAPVLRSELKEMKQAKILKALETLQVTPLESQLPDVKISGRKTQVNLLSEWLTDSGSVVTIIGCYGIGKSALAAKVGRALSAKSITSILVDCHDCISVESVIRRVIRQFGLKFRLEEIVWFYNWLNFHNQQILLILDNIELPVDSNKALSNFVEDILGSVPKLRILSTGMRDFYRGPAPFEGRVYRLEDVQDVSESLFLQVAPHLTDKDIKILASGCCHVPFAICLMANVLAFEDVDFDGIFQAVTSSAHPSLPLLEAEIVKLTSDEKEISQLKAAGLCVLSVLENIGEIFSEILCKMSSYVGGFDFQTVLEMLGKNCKEMIRDAMDSLTKLGLLVCEGSDRYWMPPYVRLISKCLNIGKKTPEMIYLLGTVEKIKNTCHQYHSRDHQAALTVVSQEYDNFVGVLSQAAGNEEVLSCCWGLASLPGAIFLHEFLPESVYCSIYDSFLNQAEKHEDYSKQCQVLSCLAYHYANRGHIDQAAAAATQAYEILPEVGKLEKAFCFYCLARIYWCEVEERSKSLILSAKALDLFQECLGCHNICTIYACEMYAWMLMETDHIQTARHVYNLSDAATAENLGEHPQALGGYNCRRVIWDQLGLYDRARQVAFKAERVAEQLLGVHPMTAVMMMYLCDAVAKKGAISDAICICVDALAIRRKVLGDSHVETGLSYKALSYLMLRGSRFDEAIVFGQKAVNTFERLDDVNPDLKVDAENVIAQAQERKERIYRPKFIERKESSSKKSVSFPETNIIREESPVLTRPCPKFIEAPVCYKTDPELELSFGIYR